MRIKHKLVKEFQYLTPDKKIFILKVGTILNDYNYRLKGESILIDRLIIDNNPEYFEVIDWKVELVSHLKSEKIPTPSLVAKKVIPFIEDMVLSTIHQNLSSINNTLDERERRLNRLESDLGVMEKGIKEKEFNLGVMEEELKVNYKNNLGDLEDRVKKLDEVELELSRREGDLEDRVKKLDEVELELSKVKGELGIMFDEVLSILEALKSGKDLSSEVITDISDKVDNRHFKFRRMGNFNQL